MERLLGLEVGLEAKVKSVWTEAYRSLLYDSVQHHHATAPLFPHHLPEVPARVWQGSLKKKGCSVRRAHILYQRYLILRCVHLFKGLSKRSDVVDRDIIKNNNTFCCYVA